MTTKHIFGKSETVGGIEIFPVKLKMYDEFISASSPLYYSKSHFLEEAKDIPLLDLLLFALRDESIIDDLSRTFSIVTDSKVNFFVEDESYGFLLSSDRIINRDNYEDIRNEIMKQNIMFEQKVYKDKLVQTYMDKVFQARAKNSIKLDFEDKISTVSVFTGKHYWDLAEYTIYQLEMDFSRVSKFKSYDTATAARCAGADVPVEHYAEDVGIFESPYELNKFTKSKENTKLNEAIK